MRSLTRHADSRTEDLDRVFKSPRRLKLRLVNRIQKEPGLFGRGKPAFKRLRGADFKGGIEGVVKLLDPDDESLFALFSKLARLMASFKGLSGTRLCQNEDAIEVLQSSPMLGSAAGYRAEKLPIPALWCRWKEPPDEDDYLVLICLTPHWLDRGLETTARPCPPRRRDEAATYAR